jgi:hypothetical protein
LAVTADARALDGSAEVRLHAVDAQRRDGAPLEATFDGWVVDVDGPAEVVVRLAPADPRLRRDVPRAIHVIARVREALLER